MATIKISKSGKGLVFTDDFGNVYVTSLTYLLGQASGSQRAPFIELTRMPMPAAQDRFRKSPVMGKDYEKILEGDERWTEPQCSHNIVSGQAHKDGLSNISADKRQAKQSYEDKKVEW